MASTERKSFCRICTGGCGMILTIDAADRIQAIRGDPDDRLTKGYACFKGLQATESHHGPQRLLNPLKRQPDGSYRPIGLEQALDEIAAKMSAIMQRDGADAMALFCGNGAMFNSTAVAMQKSFAQAIGTRQYFSTVTIDQSAKIVSIGRLGTWAAGQRNMESADVLLIISMNPLVAQSPPFSYDPMKRLKAARARGLKMIVIDPRYTETARHADLVLQPLPGQDIAILGGLIRIILTEGWQDAAFCDRHVGSVAMAQMRAAVEPFTPVYVEARAGLQPGQLRAVATLFARESKTGFAVAGTGVNMMPFSNLAQHLTDCLNVICGRFVREGEPVPSRDATAPPMPVHAEVIPPMRLWEAGGPSRIRGAFSLYGERPSGTLSDEILTPGAGQIRGLIIDGGDPMTSLPDQQRAMRAFAQIELLVAIEPWPTPTARMAHYVLPPTLHYERSDLPFVIPGFPLWPGAWVRYAAPVIAPPAGAELTDDWYVYWSLAKRLGVTVTYAGKTALDSVRPPTTDDLLSIRLAGSGLSLDDLKARPDGHDFGLAGAVVLPAHAGANAQFDVMPDDVAAEVRAFLATSDRPGHIVRDGKLFRYLLTSRRMRDTMNNVGIYLRTVRKRTPYNPAFLHPDDLAELGVVAGDLIRLESSCGRVAAVAAEDATLRRGVVTLAQGWGGLPEDSADPRAIGSNVNRLIDTDRHYEPINAMPHMSAVPVNIYAHAAPERKTQCTV